MNRPAAYYNEIEPDAAHVMRALIAEGVIAPGEVDTRSITEVSPDDLRGFTQCHFFAGGGLWSVAARMAGWPDDRPLWTGSCPCQPFSVAGKGGGTDDVRHLWPDFFRLIGAVRPPVVVGEQVAGKAGYGWLDGVCADLASEGYAGRGVDIPACSVDAPHIRQRLYWVALADATDEEARGRGLRRPSESGSAPYERAPSELAGPYGRLSVADAYVEAGARRGEPDDGLGSAIYAHATEVVALGDAFGARLERQRGHGDGAARRAFADRPVAAPDGGGSDRRNGSWWAEHEWLTCHDGKARRTQPGIPLLVDGLPGRVGLWRLAGNAISPVLAAEVLGALMDHLDSERLAA